MNLNLSQGGRFVYVNHDPREIKSNGFEQELAI